MRPDVEEVSSVPSVVGGTPSVAGPGEGVPVGSPPPRDPADGPSARPSPPAGGPATEAPYEYELRYHVRTVDRTVYYDRAAVLGRWHPGWADCPPFLDVERTVLLEVPSVLGGGRDPFHVFVPVDQIVSVRPMWVPVTTSRAGEAATREGAGPRVAGPPTSPAPSSEVG